MRKRRSTVDRLEALETRCLLSTITVTSLSDNETVDGKITLREAIRAANEDVSVDGSTAGNGADRIVFAEGLTGLISLDAALGTFTVTDDLTLSGHNVNATIIDGARQTVFAAKDSVQLRIERMRIRNADVGIYARPGAMLFVVNARIINSTVGIIGSGTENITVRRSELLRNTTGLEAYGVHEVRVSESSVSENEAKWDPAGIFVTESDYVLISNSTIANNVSRYDTGGMLAHADDAHMEVRIVNSTFSNNEGGRSYDAGALKTMDIARLEVTNSTFADNRGNYGVEVDADNRATFAEIDSSIFVNYAAADLRIDWDFDTDLQRQRVNIRNSLLGRNSDSGLRPSTSPDENGNIVGKATARLSHGLAELADNGGPTKTRKPNPDSLALDTGSNPLGFEEDQGGSPRTAGASADMGAVEVFDVRLTTSSAVELVEGDSGLTNAVFDLALVGDEPVTVNYEAIGVTATSGEDFVATSGQLVFDSTNTSHQIVVPILADDTAELDEMILVQLAGLNDEIIGVSNTMSVVISNDDTGLNFVDGTMLAIGDAGNDELDVITIGNDIRFTLNDDEVLRPASDIEFLHVELGDGDDVFESAGYTPYPVLLDAGAGDDSVLTGNGDDTIITGAGDDTVSTGDGDDSVIAGAGNDIVSTQVGHDTISGGGGADLLLGGPGRDSIDGGSSNDTAKGGAGADVLLGQSGRDKLYGEGGDDTLVGGAGADRLEGSGGHDRLYGMNPGYYGDFKHADWYTTGVDGNDFLIGGSGNDILYDTPGGYTEIEELVGGSANRAQGGTGNDLIHFFRSGGRINGGSGDDRLFNDLGESFGGAGSDHISGRGLLDGGEGPDTLQAYAAGGSATLRGGRGADELIGSESADVLDGNEGNDFIRGLAGDDTIAGGTGNDKLAGNEGNDHIDGGPGSDLLVGGKDDDTVFGSDGNDRIRGNFGRDLLVGDSESDTIHGGDGADILIGGYDGDYLIGGSNTDLLISGSVSLSDQQLNSIAQEWNSERTVAERVSNLRDGSGTTERANGSMFLVGGSTVLNDGSAIDELTGDDDLDWFFAHSATGLSCRSTS